MQEPTHLIVAEADAGDLRQMAGEPDSRPVRESVTQRHRVGRDGLLHGGEELRGSAAGTSRRLDGPQRVDPGLAVEATDPIDGEGRAAESPGDRSDGIASIGQQDDQAVAVDVGRIGREAQAVELIDLVVAEFDPSSHGNLRATVLPRV